MSVDGQTLDGQPAGTIFRLLNDKLDRNVRLRIRRGGEEQYWLTPEDLAARQFQNTVLTIEAY